MDNLSCHSVDPSHYNHSLRNFLLKNLEIPVLLKGHLLKLSSQTRWKCSNWSRKDWIKLFQKELFTVQFNRKTKHNETMESPQWEFVNLKGQMTYENILDWSDGKMPFTTNCGNSVSHVQHWAYLDYFYMKNLKNIGLADELISWKSLGFPEITAKDSTIWIGTEGANTPCHIDTYGSNIVCQLHGKKRWTLFPKSQSSSLYPTRVPYEESSIYSEVSFPKPNVIKHSKLKSTTPYFVTLEAGDVLLVPKHWWHFVENLEFCISINTWVPLPTDPNDRLKEALVLFQVGSVCQSLMNTTLLRSIYHTNMMDTLQMDSSELFLFLRNKVLQYSKGEYEPNEEAERSQRTQIELCLSCYDKVKFDIPLQDIQYVPSYSFQEYCILIGLNYANNNKNHKCDSPLNNYDSESEITKLIVKSFTDDRVIDILKVVLDENIKK